MKFHCILNNLKRICDVVSAYFCHPWKNAGRNRYYVYNLECGKVCKRALKTKTRTINTLLNIIFMLYGFYSSTLSAKLHLFYFLQFSRYINGA